MKKLAIALMTVAPLAFGVSAVMSPAEAGYYSYGQPSCHYVIKRVKVRNAYGYGWHWESQRVRVCSRY